MSDLEKAVKDYSTKKLKEILEYQAASYSDDFMFHVKDELIKRGENFSFDKALAEEISVLSDSELKNLVEVEWDDYHLEYMEIARLEYLKRNLKFDGNLTGVEGVTDAKPDVIQEDHTKYPALLTISSVYVFFAWASGILTALLTLNILINGNGDKVIPAIITLIVGALAVLILLSTAEGIRVIVDIEKNTRTKGQE